MRVGAAGRVDALVDGEKLGDDSDNSFTLGLGLKIPLSGGFGVLRWTPEPALPRVRA